MGRDLLIPISGASLRSPDELWTHALDWMDLPTSTSRHHGIGGKLGAEVGGKGSLQFPLFAKGEVSGSTTDEFGLDAHLEAVRERRGLPRL